MKLGLYFNINILIRCVNINKNGMENELYKFLLRIFYIIPYHYKYLTFLLVLHKRKVLYFSCKV